MQRKLPEGYKVKIHHARLRDEAGNFTVRGGSTYATVSNPEGVQVALGEAKCRTDEFDKFGRLKPGDAYDRHIGALVATQRAIAVLYGVWREGKAFKHAWIIDAKAVEAFQRLPY